MLIKIECSFQVGKKESHDRNHLFQIAFQRAHVIDIQR